MMHKDWCGIEEVPYSFSGSSIKFQGHTGWKINDFNPIWVRLLGRSQLSNPSDLPCSQGDTRGVMQISDIAVTHHLGKADVSPLWVYDVLAARLPQTNAGSGCLSWQPNDYARFRLRWRILWPRFILSLLVLMQSSFYNRKTYLYWQKHYDITNSSVQVELWWGHHYRQIIW